MVHPLRKESYCWDHHQDENPNEGGEKLLSKCLGERSDPVKEPAIKTRTGWDGVKESSGEGPRTGNATREIQRAVSTEWGLRQQDGVSV